VIQLSVYYPTTEGASFDHDYYRDVHVPMVREAWGVTDTVVEKGLHGPHVAAVHVTFDSLDAMSAALANSRGDHCRRGQLHDDHLDDADQRDRFLAVRRPPPEPAPAVLRT
jgi:uncharacterized protein (TIGR02118 family)